MYYNFTQHRGMFYQIHTMTLDPAARRNGWVAIVTSKNQTQSNFSWEIPPFLEKMYSLVMPIKMRTCHISYPSTGMSLLCHLPLLKAVAKRQDMRWKVYPSSTTDDKLVAQLGAYGIPRSRLPVDVGGDLRLDFEQFVADYSVMESLREMDNNTPPMIPLVVASTTSPQATATTSQQRTASSSADDMLTVDALTRASVEANTARAQILGSINSQLLHAAHSMGVQNAVSNPEEDRNSPYYYSSYPSTLAGGARVKRGGKPLGLLASSLSVPALDVYEGLANVADMAILEDATTEVSHETTTKSESDNEGLNGDQEGVLENVSSTSSSSSPPRSVTFLRPRKRELHFLSNEFQGWMEQLEEGSDETTNENDETIDSV